MLTPQPLPTNAVPELVAASKYPFTSLRKSLRLLIEDNEIDELENDISYVYSGWAPISVRLVQCVAQKGGVLSNPAEKEKKGGEEGDSKKGREGGVGRVQAHPIVGWKGFEDVIASIPGETVDIVQSVPGGVEGGASALASLSKWSYHRGSTRCIELCVLFRQCYPGNSLLPPWCSSWEDARTLRLQRCDGWDGRTKAGSFWLRRRGL